MSVHREYQTDSNICNQLISLCFREENIKFRPFCMIF